MSMKKASRRTVVTIFVGFPPATGLHTATQREPAVGIWWSEGDVAVALLQPLARGESSGGYIDSPLEHRREWAAVAHHFGCARGSEYWCVARGRVLLEHKATRGVIYHGNESDANCLVRIARIFGLSQWRSAMDDHYLMGEEADRAFEM